MEIKFPKKYLVLLGVTCFAFLFIAARPLMLGYDSYAYLATSCVSQSYNSFISSELFGVFVSALPCNLGVFYGLQFLALLCIVFCWSNIGEIFVGKHGWKLGYLILGLSPALLWFVSSFEEALFGYALSCIGVLCFALALRPQKIAPKPLLLGIACLAFVFSMLVWEASIIMVLVALLMNRFNKIFLIIAIPAGIMLINYTLSSFTALFSLQIIAEEAPIIGLFLIAHLFKPLKTTINKPLLYTSIFLILIGLVKLKYIFLCVPILVMVWMLNPQPIKFIFINLKRISLISIIAIAIYGLIFFFSSPSISEMNLVKESIQLSHDTNYPFINDWSYGWWITNQGYDTKYKSSYPNPDWNNIDPPIVALTSTDLNCLLVDKVGEMKLFKCE